MNKFMLSITASSGEFYQGDCEDLTLSIPAASGSSLRIIFIRR